MRGKKILLLCLVLAVVLGGFGWQRYQTYLEGFVTVGDVRYEKTAGTLDLSGMPLENPEVLQSFTELKTLDLRGTGLTAEEYRKIAELLPDTQILWEIPFQGAFYPMDTEVLTLEKLNADDLEALALFPELKTVSAEACGEYRLLQELTDRYPDLQVRYTVPVLGTDYACDTAHLVLPGEDVSSLGESLQWLRNLETVELTAPLAPAEELLQLREDFPQVTFSWNLELAGMAVSDRTEKLDLTGIPMTVEEMDAVLPYLTSLTYVDMTDCSISNEEMDALNRRYEDIKIVWTVVVGKSCRVRTDATFFVSHVYDFYPIGDDLHNLRYCTDMVAIDLGHRGITNCDFCAYMPKLKYLILAETLVHDLTPLTGLTELVYLEMFIMNIEDFTPLLTLTGLEDLNLCYTEGGVEVVAQMTWLKNLWWSNVEERMLTQAEQQLLRDSIPGCNFMFTPCRSSTGEGWRDLPNYFAQRDAIGMHYMKG